MAPFLSNTLCAVVFFYVVVADSSLKPLRFYCKPLEEESTENTYVCRMAGVIPGNGYVLQTQLAYPHFIVYGWDSTLFLTVENPIVKDVTFYGGVTCGQLKVPAGIRVTNCVSDIAET